MLETILDLGRNDGADTAFVLTNSSNIAAEELYSKTGGIAVNGDDLLFEYPIG